MPLTLDEIERRNREATARKEDANRNYKDMISGKFKALRDLLYSTGKMEALKITNRPAIEFIYNGRKYIITEAEE